MHFLTQNQPLSSLKSPNCSEPHWSVAGDTQTGRCVPCLSSPCSGGAGEWDTRGVTFPCGAAPVKQLRNTSGVTCTSPCASEAPVTQQWGSGPGPLGCACFGASQLCAEPAGGCPCPVSHHLFQNYLFSPCFPIAHAAAVQCCDQHSLGTASAPSTFLSPSLVPIFSSWQQKIERPK